MVNRIIQDKKFINIKLVLVLILVIALSIIIFLISQKYTQSHLFETYNEQATLKVMSYNIHHGDGKTNDQHKEKIKAIVKYIKDNNIEIAGLQEISSRPDPDVSVFLDEELKAVGYPMHMYIAPKRREGYFMNVIISKYPFEETISIGQNPCKGGTECDRAIVIGKINSPIGPITFVNTHVHHGSDNCESFKQYIRLLENYLNYPNAIFVGDFNMDTNVSGCGTKPSEYFTYSCDQSKQCSSGGIIDWVFTSKANSNLRQIYRIRDNTLTVSDHLPVVAELMSIVVPTVQPKIIASVTVTPIPSIPVSPISTPTPTVKTYPIDLDENGSIGIEDFLKFVEYYKASNCMIDYNRNNNCKDIEDFQIFVTEYGKR